MHRSGGRCQDLSRCLFCGEIQDRQQATASGAASTDRSSGTCDGGCGRESAGCQLLRIRVEREATVLRTQFSRRLRDMVKQKVAESTKFGKAHAAKVPPAAPLCPETTQFEKPGMVRSDRTSRISDAPTRLDACKTCLRRVRASRRRKYR